MKEISLLDEKIHLVIPMAGEGQRFRKAGIDTPKPLIDVGGLPMYQLVLSNLWSEHLGQITLIARSELDIGATSRLLEERLGLEINVVTVEATTGGPADSVSLAAPFLNEHEAVVVANSDQFVDAPIEDFYQNLLTSEISGSILTMEDDDKKWSYVELDSHGYVVRVVEKEVLSRYATVGIYGFRTAGLMLSAFSSMREVGDKVNGEYYVGPAYNHLERTNGPVVISHLGPVRRVMFGLGVPDDLEAFMALGPKASVVRAKKLFQ